MSSSTTNNKQTRKVNQIIHQPFRWSFRPLSELRSATLTMGLVWSKCNWKNFLSFH